MVKRELVLVVDDEEAITRVICAYLTQSGYEAVTAHDGQNALDLFDRLSPALVILDLMLPGMGGEQICDRLRKISRVPIIMLTAKTAEEDALNGLRLGADDYIRKPFSPRELMARVEAVLRRAAGEGSPLVSKLVCNDGDLVIDTLRHEVRTGGERINLTPTEYAILLTLAGHPARVFSRTELIDLTFGDDFDGYDRVIDSHIKNLRQKIENGNVRYIKTVHGVGYCFSGE